MKPLVSIIITCYNYGHFLDECIRSALGQTYEPIEVIVVNDGSTDETDDICRGFEGKILYRAQPNMGVVEAVNAGIRMSRGDFFYFLSADDKLFPDTIRKQVDVMQLEEACAVVCGNGRMIDTNGAEIGDNRQPLPSEHLLVKMLEAPNLHDGSLLFRRSCLEKINGLFFEAYENYHGFHHRCFQLARDFSIRYLDDFLVYQRVHAENLSNPKHAGKMISGYEVLRKMMREYVKPTDLFEGLDTDDKDQLAMAYAKSATLFFFFGQYEVAYSDFRRAVGLCGGILDQTIPVPEMTPSRYVYPLGKYEDTNVPIEIIEAQERRKDPEAEAILDDLRSGRMLKAFYRCRRMLEDEPGRDDLELLLAQIYLQQPQIQDSANRYHRITVELLKRIRERNPLHSVDLYLWLACLDESSMDSYLENLTAQAESLKFFDIRSCLWLIKVALTAKKQDLIRGILSIFNRIGLTVNFDPPRNPERPGQTKTPPGTGKLRILFISPPYARIMGLGNCRFPLSFGNMATILAQNGHAVGIYDADFDRSLMGRSGNYEYTFTHQDLIAKSIADDAHPVWKEVAAQVRDFRPDLVGITAMTTKFPTATRIARIVKEVDPDIRTVIGGHHPSIFGDQLMHDRNIDFAVVGEGEMTMLELVNRLADPRPDFSAVRGLVYRDGGKIITTEPRKLVRHLEALPIAERSLMINPGFVSENNVMTSRGCPFSCHYCGAQIIWQHKVRRRSVGHVMKEIDYLLGHSRSKHISFWDDSFTMGKKYTLELTDALRKCRGITFSCITRLDLIDDEILSNLKQAGCSNILFGIESGSDKMLSLMNKKMSRDFIRNQIDLVRKHDLYWIGFFIMGYPGETREEMFETVRFMKELDPPYAEINIFNPLPGTRIWDDLEAADEVSRTMDFSKFSQSSLNNYFLKDVPQEEFRELALGIIREFDRHNLEKSQERT